MSNTDLKPAVPIEESVTYEHLICLEDGKALKTLKRHLAVNYSMSVEEYRKRWNLPEDYPEVAESYLEQRFKLAKQSGLYKDVKDFNAFKKLQNGPA